jgi:hypothetical protein
MRWWGGVLVGVVSGAVVPAEADVVATAEVRWRGETDRKLVSGDNVSEVQLLRSRVGLTAEGENVGIFVQIQDSRALGRLGTSGTLTGDTNLGVHQAYFRADEVLHPAASLQAGRFELVYGNERVLGAVGWSNTARAFEGVRVGLDLRAVTLDLVHANLVDREDAGDSNLWMTYLRAPDLGVDLFLLVNSDRRLVPTGRAADDRRLCRYTLGLYTAREVARSIDYVANAAYQFGTVGTTAAADPIDIAAYLLTVEVGMSFDQAPVDRVGIGLDLASGDDGDADGEWNAYDNEFYTGHKFRGHMDQFLASNPEGLLDLYGTVRVTPADRWSMELTGHLFRTAEPYPMGVDEESSQVGTEVDVAARTSVVEGVDAVVGGAVFAPAEDFAGSDADPEFWAYVQLSVRR